MSPRKVEVDDVCVFAGVLRESMQSLESRQDSSGIQPLHPLHLRIIGSPVCPQPTHLCKQIANSAVGLAVIGPPPLS